MTAREELFEFLTPMYREQFAPGEEESANALLDAYRDEVAHELADQARKIMGPRHLPSGAEPENIARYVAGWHDAVDFIDPEMPNA